MIEPPLRSRNFDVLRGLAVSAVVSHHVFAHTGLTIAFLGHFGGLLGVQLFFLVSGFLIVQSAVASSATAYFLRRGLRIFPLYWLVVLGWSAWYGKLDADLLQLKWPDFLANWLVLSHFVPAALFGFDVLTVSWTLSIELVWYALVPLIVCLARLMPGRLFWLGFLCVTLSASTIWVWLAQRGQLDFLYAGALARAGISPVSDSSRFAFVVNAFPAQLVFFGIGAALWYYRSALSLLPSWLLLLVAVVLAGWPEYWNQWLHLNPSPASGVGLAALFVLVLRQERWRLSLLKWLGEISYPVYLLHVPILLLVFQHWKLSGWGAVALAMSIILVASTWLHHLVERPCIAWGRTLFSSGTRPYAYSSPSV